MDSLNRLELSATFLLVLMFRLSCSFEVSRLRHGPSVLEEESRLSYQQRESVCKEVPPRILRQVMGSAYNEYYMSFDIPTGPILGAHREDTMYKRSNENETITTHPFWVKEDYEVVLSDEPAWTIGNATIDENSNRSQQSSTSKSKREEPKLTPAPGVHRSVKRSVPDYILDAIALSEDTNFRWHCDAPLRWTDLGKDYFPRYILSVDCSHHSCQGSRFHCEPRSFGIKVLRRRDGVCVPGLDTIFDDNTIEIGNEQMPHALRELWVWEMRAVSFCCVCQFMW